MVHGVYVSTFALGGDTRVFHAEGPATGWTSGGASPLRPVRPLSRRQGQASGRARPSRPHPLPLHECFLLLHPPKEDKDIPKKSCGCAAPGIRPLSLEEAAAAAKVSPYVLSTERLEREGILLPCRRHPHRRDAPAGQLYRL